MLEINTSIQSIKRISPAYQKRLLKLGIKTLRDLFYHFPHRYDDFSKITAIGDLKLNEVATVQGKIIEIKNIRTWRKKIFITEAYIEDSSGTIKAVWFNQPYLANTLKKDSLVSLSGRVNFNKALYLSNPAYEKLIANSKSPIGNQNAISYKPLAISTLRHTGRLVPVYPETAGLSSRYLRYLIQIFLPTLAQIKDWLPPEIKKSQRLLDLNFALKQIHFPVSDKAAAAAKRRLAFDELFLIQIFALQQKIKWQKGRSLKIPFDQELIKNFVDRLPFRLTNAQRQAAWEILQDLNKTRPMNRLLEGDVGSGKTVVAAMAALSVVKNGWPRSAGLLPSSAGWQVAFMAPTEILARQHFKTINELFADYNIRIALLIGGEKSSVKKEIVRQIADGKIQIIIGTHALIQKEVKFKNLALAVVDEQHRFGVSQRATLARGLSADITRTDTENKLIYEDITYKIRKCIFAVRKNIGLGHKESVYQQALEQEFNNSGLRFEKEKQINIMYNGKKIGTYQPDFIVEDKIIIELKALPFIGITEKRQIWTYIKGSEYKLGLLVNYSPTDVEIKRIIYDSARELPRESAFSPRESALVPHLLSMTATPIPRTLALTLYGDLDISLLNEMPGGRQKIITRIVAPTDRQKAYEFIRQQVRAGRQVFVICPRIEISDKCSVISDKNNQLNTNHLSLNTFRNWDEVKAVKEEYKKLSEKIFPDLKIAMLHGKMKSKEKEKTMMDFSAPGRSASGGKNGKIDILVSTSVVEVGIDIPNAALMLIEGAERFGLAQLHQFRGRVGRGEHQSYCLLFTDSASRQTQARLKALLTCENGFELAEKDLAIRGPGEFFGTRQWGLPDLSMASLTDIELIKEARAEAAKILTKDPGLKNYPLLWEKLKDFQKTIHFE